MTDGRKDDAGKLRYDLMPIHAEQEVVDVLTKGAEKYGDHNWICVERPNYRYYSAMRRHVAAWQRGEQTDPETNNHHLAHAVCSLLFLLELDLIRSTGECDDA